MAADAAHGRHRRLTSRRHADPVVSAVLSLIGVAAALCLVGLLTACAPGSDTPAETDGFLTAKPARQLCLENSWRFQFDARECDGDEAAPLGDCLTAACADIILRRPPSYDPNQTRS